MDSKVTLQEIRDWCAKVRNERNWHPDARSLSISIILEAAEILEHFQFKESQTVEEAIKKDKAKKEEVAKEIGDVLNYLCELVDRLDIDISDTLKMTLKKVEKKYPVEELKNGGEKFYLAQKKKYREGRK